MQLLLQAEQKRVPSVAVGIIMATTQITVVILSPIVGYLVSALQECAYMHIANPHAAALCWSGLTSPFGFTVDRTFVHSIGVSLLLFPPVT